ncbi:MAG: peptidylprolyl isomerase [Clostridia bacterium]|nr:peptidylprolyl isomerase [Clostridia bacterium]
MDKEKSYTAEIKIKNYGTVKAELYPKAAPMTVANFVDLANRGFYNGLTFHRIIDGFMMQGGDPKGNGTGGSDNNIFGEFSQNGFNNTIKHEKGVLSMARSGDPNSASSQFFIMHDAAPHLDGGYAAFGKVIEGLDIVDKVCKDAEPIDGNGTIPAAAQPIIESVTVTVK